MTQVDGSPEALARRLDSERREGFPYPDNRGQTHYESCWRDPKHHNCAVERVELLQKELDRVRRSI